MDFGCGSSAGSSGGDGIDPGSGGSGGSKRKWNWSDLETTMKAVKDTLKEENASKSAKIHRLMVDKVRLEQTVLHLENLPFHGQTRPMPSPNPFVVFPAEVWKIIIGNMNRSSDLQMLCLAFPQLKPLVKERNKTIFLFENVLPLVFNQLGWKDVKNCRLACDKWNRDVCDFMVNWNSPNLLPVDASSHDELATKPPVPVGKPPYIYNDTYSFNSHRKIQKFLNKMVDHPGNPFVGRYLRLSVDGRTELQHFWKSVLELLEKFGEHIWNLKIECYRSSHKQISFYKSVQETLIQLPNLRYLTVKCIFTGLGPSKVNMAAQIGSSPLPPLPYLQSAGLALNGETGMINAFSSFFSRQIRQLKLLRETLGNVNFKDEWLRGLINLEHLEVELKSKEEILRLLNLHSPNLKKLCITSFYCNRGRVSINLGQLGSLLEKFSRLDYLDVHQCQLESSCSLGLRMQFSQLKTLKIGVGINDDDRLHNLDFLMWFPSLKHLIIKKIYTDDDETNRLDLDQNSRLKIRTYLASSRLLDSNVWMLIPSLESLELQDYNWEKVHKNYTREMLENRGG